MEPFENLMRIGGGSILNKFKLDFLKLKPEYKTISLPGHMGRLTKPIVELIDKEEQQSNS